MTAIINQDENPKSVYGGKPYAYLYSWPTTNGTRPTIFLELVKAKYYLHKLDISKKTQKEDWYLKHNANGKIPTLVWVDINGSATYINESAAILVFLAEKLDKEHKYSYAVGTENYFKDLEWLFFILSGLGPNKSNWKYFSSLPEKNTKVIKKYKDELLRALRVIETQLEKNQTGYLVGEHSGLADIALYPWIGKSQLSGLKKEITALPNVHEWIKKFDNNATVQKGYSVFDQEA